MNYNVLGKDAFSIWCKIRNKAQSELVVFSPYVDNTVRRLLISDLVKKDVKLSLVTRVDSDTIFDKPYQVRALINCAKKGVVIRHLDGLHAKIMIVDGSVFTLGSQNFTSRGRKNKEATIANSLTGKDSDFLNTIISWYNESNIVELDYLLSLESKLKKFRPKIKNLRDQHADAFSELENEFNQIRLKILAENLDRQKQKSLLRFASSNIRATMKLTGGYENVIKTLLADSNYSFTLWKNEKGELVKLRWLNYYLMINYDTGALAYVRIASTRISYYLTKVIFTGYHDERYSRVSIEFPSDNLEKHNIKFVINIYDNSWRKISANLFYHYDGNYCKLVSDEYEGEEVKLFVKRNILSSKESEDKFIDKYFRQVDPQTLGRSIYHFLEGTYYDIFIVQHRDTPILVAKSRY